MVDPRSHGRTQVTHRNGCVKRMVARSVVSCGRKVRSHVLLVGDEGDGRGEGGLDPTAAGGGEGEGGDEVVGVVEEVSSLQGHPAASVYL